MNGLRAGLPLVLAAALVLSAHPSRANGPLGLLPTQAADAYRQHVGQRFTFVCPASDGMKTYVYGTDTYTDNSAVCAAAIHAGVLAPATAGVVTILIGGGAPSFKGTERNGVSSKAYAAWPHSYSFVTDGTPGSVTWATTWNGVPENFTQPIVTNCPANGATDKGIWGTDVYAKGSAICVAAVHAGAITADKGGLVTVSRVPDVKQYPGSQRFRVTSQEWRTAFPDGFRVAAATRGGSPPASAPPPPPASPALGPRTIQLAGFAAGGQVSAGGSPVGPRTIQLAGFVASGTSSSGTASAVSPRTITTTGWAAGLASPP
jgi:hypothetical protein